MNKMRKLKEFNVPVPWGHIAVKTWGHENDEAVLVFHGRLDNAGAFDRLIPHLPNSFYYICVDLPSHGRSSHFPPYLPIYSLNFLLAYNLLVQYFKRENYIIMGHSYGGQIGFLFAQLYPTYVKKIIMLDTVHLYTVAVKEFKNYLVDACEYNMKVQEKLKMGIQPTYTYEEALNKLLNGRQFAPLNKEAAIALLERSVQKNSDGRYTFTFDQRMKNFVNPLHDFRYTIETLREHPVTCPVLIVLGQKSYSKDHMQVVIDEIKSWSNITIEYVDGYHDIHNNDPEIVGPIVSKFLLTQKGKL